MISIVTITYNNPNDLKKTLISIQGIDNIESVVINGGRSLKAIKILKKFNGIHINEPDKGIADAFNKGIRYSTGNAIVFLNSGDILTDKEYIRKADKMFKDDSALDYIYSDMIYGHPLIGKIIILARPNGHPSKGMPYPHPTLIIRSDVLRRLKGFKTFFKISMDFELVIRLKKRGFKGRYIKGPVAFMDGNGISSKKKLETMKEYFRALSLNYPTRKFLVPFAQYFFFFLVKEFLFKFKMTFLLLAYKKVRSYFFRNYAKQLSS